MVSSENRTKRFIVYTVGFLLLLVLTIKGKDGFAQPDQITDDPTYQEMVPFVACSHAVFLSFYLQDEIRNEYDLEKLIEASCLYCVDDLMEFKRYVLKETEQDHSIAGNETLALLNITRGALREAARAFDTDKTSHTKIALPGEGELNLSKKQKQAYVEMAPSLTCCYENFVNSYDPEDPIEEQINASYEGCEEELEKYQEPILAKTHDLFYTRKQAIKLKIFVKEVLLEAVAEAEKQ